MRKANVYLHETLAGVLTESDAGYEFAYEVDYLRSEVREPISATLPLQPEKFVSKTLFAFFDGLIPEGWLLEFAEANWKLNRRDRMGLLLACCKDCIGAVSITHA